MALGNNRHGSENGGGGDVVSYAGPVKAHISGSHAEGQGDGDSVAAHNALNGVSLYAVILDLVAVAKDIICAVAQIAQLVLAAGLVHADAAQTAFIGGLGALDGDGQVMVDRSILAHDLLKLDGVGVLAIKRGVLGQIDPGVQVLLDAVLCNDTHLGARDGRPRDEDVVRVIDCDGVVRTITSGASVVDEDLWCILTGSKSARDHRGDHQYGQQRRE